MRLSEQIGQRWHRRARSQGRRAQVLATPEDAPFRTLDIRCHDAAVRAKRLVRIQPEDDAGVGRDKAIELDNVPRLVVLPEPAPERPRATERGPLQLRRANEWHDRPDRYRGVGQVSCVNHDERGDYLLVGPAEQRPVARDGDALLDDVRNQFGNLAAVGGNLHSARGAPWAERVVSPTSTADAHEREEPDVLAVAQHKNHRVHGRDMVDGTHGQWILVEQIPTRQVGTAGRHHCSGTSPSG